MRQPCLHTRSDLSFNELARRINPVVAGWLNYYGRFRPWELRSLVMRINTYLVRWIRQKYKRLAGKRKAIAKMQEIAQRYPPHVRALAPDHGRRAGLMTRATRAE